MSFTAPLAPGHPALRHPDWRGYQCLRCARSYGLDDLPEGCPACAAEGAPASVAARYAGKDSTALPYLHPFSLGEGRTPCPELPRLAAEAGVARLWVKNESANPTGSHKDRMSALALTHALARGAHTVVLASSGNAALSAAAYCAAAGLACEVAAYQTLAEAYARGLALHGARVVAFDSSFARWAHVRERAKEGGVFALTNYTVPPVGSAAVAVEAYKAVAWECVDDGVLPDHVLVPTARGDLLWGLWAGFEAARREGRVARVPRLWAIEPFARLTRVLDDGVPLAATHAGRTAQFSIAGETVTYQQWLAVRESRGGAVVVGDEAALRARALYARHGLWPELCAAAPLAALQQLRATDRIAADETALLLLTARGDRDSAAP